MMRYGVVTDLHAPRQDGGAPVLWDGWYANRQDAVDAQIRLEAQYPGAAVHLVERV
jgi:hypothetical protein